MPGVTISRWTMAYFTVALCALVLSLALMSAGIGYPTVPLRAPATLVIVHLVAIGWLSLLLCGALFQFVPVLVARRLHSDNLPLPTLILLIAGLSALVLGFLQVAGAIPPDIPLLPTGAGLLVLGVGLAIYNLARTIAGIRPLPLPARFVAMGLVALAGTALLGATFALILSGFVETPVLARIAASGVPIHAAAGLLGWLTITAVGVSYRLLAMFMLSPEPAGRRPRAVFWVTGAALVCILAGGMGALLLNGALEPVFWISGLLTLAALGLYGGDIIDIYRARRRREIELNSQMATVALASLVVIALLAVLSVMLGQVNAWLGGLVFLFAFSWLSGLGLAKLYKIVTFLTWLEYFGPRLGLAKTPRVQDLVDERRARGWFVLYFTGTWIAGGSLLFGPHIVSFRLACAAMLAAVLGIAAEIWRTRKLKGFCGNWALPSGARPSLFHAASGMP